MDIDYSEILGSDSEGEGHIVPSPSPKLRCHLEITLKHPCDTKWSSSPSTIQKEWYRKAWNNIVNTGGISNIVDTGYVYEFHKNGHVHLHGYIKFEMSSKFSPIGLIADYSKMYYLLLSKKHTYKEAHMYYDYMRYASPAICVQYVNDIEKPERFGEWKTYLLKENAGIKK